MQINNANLKTLYTAFNAAFKAGLGQAASQYGQIATTVPSTTSAEEYGWLGQLPGLREWLGDRVVHAIGNHGYTIKNKPFELTVGVPRSAIEAYAAAHGLRWIDDESNEDVHFRRNFLRREIIPRLEEKFSGTQRSLARAAGHFAEGAELLNDLAAIDRAAVLTPTGRLGLAAFNALPMARARNLLRHEWLSAGFRAPDTRWIDEARHQLATTDALSETCLKTPEGELRVYRGEIYVVRHRPDTADAIVHWQGEDELPWAGGRVRFVEVDGGGIRRALLESGAVFIRSRQGGERLQAHQARPRRSLRNLLQEASIPTWERSYLPYLWCSDRLAWVAGLGVDVKFACPAGENGVLPVWEPD